MKGIKKDLTTRNWHACLDKDNTGRLQMKNK